MCASEVEKAELVEKICAELIVHTQIGEEVFYPEVRAAIDDEDLMDEADVEHAVAPPPRRRTPAPRNGAVV